MNWLDVVGPIMMPRTYQQKQRLDWEGQKLDETRALSALEAVMKTGSPEARQAAAGQMENIIKQRMPGFAWPSYEEGAGPGPNEPGRRMLATPTPDMKEILSRSIGPKLEAMAPRLSENQILDLVSPNPGKAELGFEKLRGDILSRDLDRTFKESQLNETRRGHDLTALYHNMMIQQQTAEMNNRLLLGKLGIDARKGATTSADERAADDDISDLATKLAQASEKEKKSLYPTYNAKLGKYRKQFPGRFDDMPIYVETPPKIDLGPLGTYGGGKIEPEVKGTAPVPKAVPQTYRLFNKRTGAYQEVTKEQYDQVMSRSKK